MAANWPEYAYPGSGPDAPRPVETRGGLISDYVDAIIPAPYYTQPDGVGRYFIKGSRQDVTGECRLCGAIYILPDGSYGFEVGQWRVTPPSFQQGAVVLANLYNHDRGGKWDWLTAPEGYADCRVLCQTQTQEVSFLSLAIEFEGPVILMAYPFKAAEPRLRPTTHGLVELGRPVGVVVSQDREIIVYDRVYVYDRPNGHSRR